MKGATMQDQKQREGLEKAQMGEIKLVFRDLKAMEVIRKEDLPKGFKAHNMHLFTVEKFTAEVDMISASQD